MGRSLAFVVMWTVAGVAFAAAPPPTPGASADRSRELLDYRCESDLGRRRVTLFANGTVRVWEGLHGEPTMTLGEIGPVELDGYLRRLAAEDLSEVDASRAGPGGSWVEQCTFVLATAEPVRRYTFGRYDSLPLALSVLVRIAEEVAAHARPLDRLPMGYEPRRGDLLRRADGVVFRVVAFTADGQGLELLGRDQPLTVYVRPEDLRVQFDALLSRRAP